MERNQIMKDVINHLKNRLDGADGSKQDGFKKRVSEIEEMVNRNDSTEFMPFANKEAFATYNHAEDLKDEGARTEDILYAEGEYKAYEAFLEKFNKWLAKQDEEIGRASCRERGEMSAVAEARERKNNEERHEGGGGTHE